MPQPLAMVLVRSIEAKGNNLHELGEIRVFFVLINPYEGFFTLLLEPGNSLMSLEKDILEWIENVSEIRPELGGFAICPFARKSIYKIAKCSIKDITPYDGFDVIIFSVEMNLTLNQINDWVSIYNNKYPKWKFFEDCASYDTYISGIKTNNGKYNLILGQPKEKLRKFREILAKTNYYDYWNNNYLKEILEDDFDILE